MAIVPPTGPTNSPDLAIVGEAPGADEERLGLPFVGASGHLLNSILDHAGLKRNEIYITNLAKTRPPGNNFAHRYYEGKGLKNPTGELIELRQQLWSELRAVNPKVIVTLGVEALKALGGNATSLADYRGTMIDHFGIRVLPTYHPAYLLRGNYGDRVIVAADFRKAKRQAVNPSKPTTRFNINPTFDEVMHVLRDKRIDRMALDIETVQNQTRMIGLAWSPEHALVIPLYKGREHAWTMDEEFMILQALDRRMRDPYTRWILQNMLYDCTVLGREFGLRIANLEMDTMLAHHLLWPELPKGLDFLSSIYTDHPMYWGYDRGTYDQTATYCATDCVATFEAAQKIRIELDGAQQWDYYTQHINRTVQAILYIQSRGVRIDLPAREAYAKNLEGEIDVARSTVHSLVRPDFNPGSTAQLKALFYDEWKLPVQLKLDKATKSKKPTVDDDAVTALIDIAEKRAPQHVPVLRAVSTFRTKRNHLSLARQALRSDGRAVTSYNVAGTVTGRLASSASIDKLGGNLQNILRGSFRRVYIADPGHVLLKTDSSQAEYRVLIWKARIHRVISRWLTEPGFNIHKWNACENIFRIPYAQLTDDQYAKSKNGVYGANYGIGPLKVSRMYGIPLQESKFIISRYHEAVPEVKGVYQQEIIDELMATRRIVNPFGRVRTFTGRLDDDTFRQAFSSYCQSTVGDLINNALVALHGQGYDVLLQVHDELVIQVPDDEQSIRQAATDIRREFERPIHIPGNDIPLVIPCDIKIGRNWYDTLSVDKWLAAQKEQPVGA